MPQERDRAHRLSLTLRLAIAFIVAIAASYYQTALKPSARRVQAQSVTTAGQETVIGRDCLQCHRAIVNSFALDLHGKSGKFLRNSRSATCEKCHENSEAHAESSTKTRSAGNIGNPGKLTGSEANKWCLGCHSQDRTHFAWTGGKHDRNDMSCLSCHNVHHSQLLVQIGASLTAVPENEAAQIINVKLPDKMLTAFTVEETCLRCHTEQRKALFQRSTHLFRTEARNLKVSCTSCHNPHGGEAGKMLANFTVNDVCYTCHAEKRGPFLWDHPPVRENCMNCHSPHGSSNPKLLTARAHLLCQQCHIHMLPRHSTTAGKPMDIFTINRGCANCHGQVHGSNHPGGRTLTR